MNRPPWMGTMASSGRRRDGGAPGRRRLDTQRRRGRLPARPDAAADGDRRKQRRTHAGKDTLRRSMTLVRAPSSCCCCPLGVAGGGQRPPAAPVRGVALGLFSEDPGWSYRPLLDEIAATGADTVELVVAVVPGRRVVDRGRRPSALHAAAGGHDRRRHPRRPRRRPRGRPVPHRAAVERRAPPTNGAARCIRAIAPPGGAAIGARLVELARAGRREPRRRALGRQRAVDARRLPPIATPGPHSSREVRRVFHGALMYSGNWDHFRDVAIYDLVDLVGLCAYFALVEPRRRPPPSRS